MNVNVKLEATVVCLKEQIVSVKACCSRLGSRVLLSFETTLLIRKPRHGSNDYSGGLETRFEAVKRGAWFRDIDPLPKKMYGNFTKLSPLKLATALPDVTSGA
jgi:hypothetical protein